VVQPSAIPGVATARLRDLLAGPARPGVLVHVGRDATYVDLGERCVGVLSAAAVQVPCGIRTTLPALPPLDRAAPVSVGDRVLTLGPLRVRVARLVDLTTAPGFRGSSLALLAPQPAERPRSLRRDERRWLGCGALVLRCELASLEGSLETSVAAAAAELPAAALAALRAGDPAAVPALLGRGSGLTPLGDDVLCGWLATSRLLDDPARPAVAAATVELAARRTTRLSAELLACAVDGEVLPELRRLLAALAAGTGVDDALAALLRVGHTSGAGLALGCAIALGASAGSANGSRAVA
jgi:hypothetical protein